MFLTRNLKTGNFHPEERVAKSLQITSFLTTLGLVANFGATSSSRANDNEFHKTDQGISVNIGLIPVTKIKQN